MIKVICPNRMSSEMGVTTNRNTMAFFFKYSNDKVYKPVYILSKLVTKKLDITL